MARVTYATTALRRIVRVRDRLLKKEKVLQRTFIHSPRQFGKVTEWQSRNAGSVLLNVLNAIIDNRSQENRSDYCACHTCLIHGSIHRQDRLNDLHDRAVAKISAALERVDKEGVL